MKSLKKVFAGLFAMAMAISLFVAPSAFAESGSYVFDEYGVFTTSQFHDLEAQGNLLAEEYGQGVYLYVTDTMGYGGDPSPSQRNEFARSFYESKGLGLGPDRSGIIFVIAVESRDYVTVKKQGANDPYSDECVNAMESNVVEYLSRNDWYNGSRAYYSTIDEQLAYYAATGKQWTEPNPLSLLLKILALLGVPALISGGVVRGEKNAMRTARERNEASEYLDQGSLDMKVSTDQFVNTSLIATPRPKASSGGGGGWSGMGGGFSGSGGGKF